MRQFKFRIWNKVKKKWLFGYDYPNLGGFALLGETNYLEGLQSEIAFHELNDVVVMQFTGQYDREKNPIYEGDIVEFDAHEWGSNDNKFLVEWDDKYACWQFGGGAVSEMEYRTVIGNIFENPELLNS